MVNLYPYWAGNPVNQAMALFHDQYQQVKSVAGSKEVVISETGWPSCGEQIGEAIASPENAALYFSNFVSWAQMNDVNSYAVGVCIAFMAWALALIDWLRMNSEKPLRSVHALFIGRAGGLMVGVPRQHSRQHVSADEREARIYATDRRRQ